MYVSAVCSGPRLTPIYTALDSEPVLSPSNSAGFLRRMMTAAEVGTPDRAAVNLERRIHANMVDTTGKAARRAGGMRERISCLRLIPGTMYPRDGHSRFRRWWMTKWNDDRSMTSGTGI